MNGRRTKLGKSPHAPAKAANAERTRSALELRIAGKSFRQISEELDIGLGHAHRLVRDALLELREQNKEFAQYHLDIELARCDRLQAQLDPAIEKGDVRAIEASLKIVDRVAKLLGLDKPQKVEHSGGIVTPAMAAEFAEEAFGSASPLTHAAAPSADSPAPVAPDAVPVPDPVDH
jgi:chemotaxis protein histidine kinase CheA